MRTPPPARVPPEEAHFYTPVVDGLLRFGELPAAVVARIEAAEMEAIERWFERGLRAQTLAEVLDDPS